MATRVLKVVKSAAVRTLLAPAPLRHRIAFEIRSRYFAELDIVVPLSPRVLCPIPHNDAWISFHEIFVKQEYAPAFDRMPLPRRWIDLGCYAGFFSAEILRRRDRADLPADFQALLVDGDSRSGPAIDRLAACNHLEQQLRFERGVISAHNEPQSFLERPYMGSTLAALSDAPGKRSRVPALSATEILARFPGPYDLIKADIEGAERDFFLAYRPLLAATRFLLVEWHHWARGGVTPEQACDLLGPSRFRLVAEISPPRNCGDADDFAAATCGVLLFENDAPPAQ